MRNILLGLFIGVLVVGCASFATNTFRTEQTAVNVAYTAYQGYTQGLASGSITVTTDQSNSIKQARLKFAASVSTLDAWRSAYETNSQTQPQVQAALDAALAQSSNLVFLINLFYRDSWRTSNPS